MKKTVVLFLSLLTVISSLAMNLPANESLRNVLPNRMKPESGLKADFSKDCDNHRIVTKATKADDQAGIEGLWTFQLGDYYFEDSVLGSIYIDYEASLEDGVITFKHPGAQYNPFVGYYSEENSIILFTRQYMGKSQQYYVYQNPFEYNAATNKIEYTDLYCFYDAEGQILSFIPDTGIAWTASTDEAGTDIRGFFDIYDFISAFRPIEEDDPENWEYIGEATLMDGWLLPSLGFDQTQSINQYKVPLEQNIENPSVYRLVGPYHLGPMADANQASNTGYIVFDVSDPDHVLFLKSDAGFANPYLYINRFYCYNQLGARLMEEPEGTTPEELIQKLGDKIPYTTFKDGVVSLGYIGEGENILYDANFGYDGDTLGGYCWDDVSMVASITFPTEAGVEGIIDNTKGETIIYNIQGMRIKSEVQNLPKGIYTINGKKVVF